MANKSDKSESNININQGRVIGNIVQGSVDGGIQANITNSTVSTNESSNNPERKNSELDELLVQIEKLIENDTSLSNNNKDKALKKVKVLRDLTKEPLNDNIKDQIDDAFKILENIVSKISTVTALSQAFQKLSSIIVPFLPFN